jgi:hypothetical protein
MWLLKKVAILFDFNKLPKIICYSFFIGLNQIKHFGFQPQQSTRPKKQLVFFPG